LWLYFICGVGANLICLVFAPFSTVPLIGASGAIAGVMAAYFSLFPGSRFTTLFIIVWVLLQFLYGTFAVMQSEAGLPGVAWWAHVGGFLLGLALIRLLAPPGVRLIPLRSRPKSPPQD
jgi:membrane associated rhomboid family serine protease